jgi:hypothetical protein
MNKGIALQVLDVNLLSTFNIIYKFRFNKDYLINNINKKNTLD